MKMPEGYYSSAVFFVGCKMGFRYKFYVEDDGTCAIQYQQEDEDGWVDVSDSMAFDPEIAEAIAAHILAVAKSSRNNLPADGVVVRSGYGDYIYAV